MRFYDDGDIGVSIELLVGAVRLLKTPGAPGEMTDYVGSGMLERVSSRVAKLLGFSGVMGIRHQALLASALLAQGYKVLYVERAAGGIIAFGEVIYDGDFAGHIRVDLERVRDKRLSRNNPGGLG